MVNKILITGANGFLASHLIKLLEGTNLVALVREGSVTHSKYKNIRFYTSVHDLLRSESSFSKIYHLAAYIPYGNMNVPNSDMVATNVELTYQLTRNYPESKFIYASSISVYGDSYGDIVRVESPFKKPSLYGLSKLAGEAVVRNCRNFSIVRFSSLIGPKMATKTFIPIVIEKSKIERKIILLGKGERKQNYLDVRDAAFLLKVCGESTQNIITLGVSKTSYSNLEIAQIIAKYTDANIEYNGEDLAQSYFYDDRKLHDEIDFRQSYTIEQTLKDMIYA